MQALYPVYLCVRVDWSFLPNISPMNIGYVHVLCVVVGYYNDTYIRCSSYVRHDTGVRSSFLTGVPVGFFHSGWESTATVPWPEDVELLSSAVGAPCGTDAGQLACSLTWTYWTCWNFGWCISLCRCRWTSTWYFHACASTVVQIEVEIQFPVHQLHFVAFEQ